MELTVEFTEDGKYELHYYVAGKEGSKYPKFGKYEMDDNRIILVDDDGYGEIVNGELILYFDNGKVKQYFRPVSWDLQSYRRITNIKKSYVYYALLWCA